MTAPDHAIKDASDAVHLSTYQGLLNMAGAVISFLAWHSRSSTDLFWLEALTFGSGLALILAARLFREHWNDRTSSIAFLLALIPVVLMVWGVQSNHARIGEPWSAFQEHELSLLTVAILAPMSIWAGVGGIALFAGAALLQYQQFAAPERQWIAAGAIQGVLATTVFALLLLFFRIQNRRATIIASRTAEEARMMQQLAKTLLAVRDLANSPIQALTIDSELLRRKYPEAAPLAERIGSATARLQQLNAVLGEHSPGLRSEFGDESIDSHNVLADLNKSKPSH